MFDQTFITSALMAALPAGVVFLLSIVLWINYKWYHDKITRLKPWIQKLFKALIILVFLAGFPVWKIAFDHDYNNRITTLHEEIVKGSSDIKDGEILPMREIRFIVEHPETEHRLYIAFRPEIMNTVDIKAMVSIRMKGPDKSFIVAVDHTFVLEAVDLTESEKSCGYTTYFTPHKAGEHILHLFPMTPGISTMHVRINDPLKRNGRRMSGY